MSILIGSQNKGNKLYPQNSRVSSRGRDGERQEGMVGIKGRKFKAGDFQDVRQFKLISNVSSPSPPNQYSYH